MTDEKLGKYVVLMQFFRRSNPYPEEPTPDNTFDNLTACEGYYKRQAVESGHDYQLIGEDDGGACWADINLTANWDGISYGDGHMYRLELGARGGVVRTSW